MNKSESIKELAAALCKAQAQVEPAIKDSNNPFFKSKYADFSSVLDACARALSDNGLAIIQAPVSDEHGAGVETLLMHSSGEWVSERLVLPVAKDDAQGFGSAVTYARRYALEGFLRIKREDDDGNAAAEATRRAGERRAAPPPKAAAPEPAKADPKPPSMAAKVQAAEAILLGQRRCAEGDLVAYVLAQPWAAGRKLEQLTPDANAQVSAALKRFEELAGEAVVQADVDELEAEMARVGVDWDKVRPALDVAPGAGPTDVEFGQFRWLMWTLGKKAAKATAETARS